MKQGHRIRSAGDGDEDGLPTTEQPPFADGLFDALEQVTHVAMLTPAWFEASGLTTAVGLGAAGGD